MGMGAKPTLFGGYKKHINPADLANERVFTEIKRLCYQGLDSATLRQRLVERLGSVVPFDAYCAYTIDPLSGLPTHFLANEAIGADEREAMFFLQNIYFDDDVSDTGWMARNRLAVLTLSEATGGKLERALRHREFNAPMKGLGYELRGVFTTGGGKELWGALCIVREQGLPDFDEREVGLIGRIAPHLGAGLRTAVLREQARRPELEGSEEAPGVLILDSSGRVVQSTAAAVRWLRELNDEPLWFDAAKAAEEGGLPTAVMAVVGALQRALRPQTDRDLHRSPQICVQGRSGRWLTLQASLTEPRPDRPAETVVVIAPAGSQKVARLYTIAYGLSPREKEVADLVVRGYSTKQISAALYISEYTVQVHVKHVFEKVGVRSRRELLKRLFFGNVLPDMCN
jgi:DNA-binding CsgD family transcriptional regulator